MNTPNESQRAALGCIRRQLETANGDLRKLIARRHEFEITLPATQNRKAELQAAGDLSDATILALLTAERKSQFILAFLNISAPQVTELELFVLEQIRQLEKTYTEIFPGALNKPPQNLPLWAGNGAGANHKAADAIAEIDRLLA